MLLGPKSHAAYKREYFCSILGKSTRGDKFFFTTLRNAMEAPGAETHLRGSKNSEKGGGVNSAGQHWRNPPEVAACVRA